MFYRALLLLVCLATAQFAQAAIQLQAVRAAVHPDHTRVVLDISGPARYRIVEEPAEHNLQLVIDDAVLNTKIHQQLFVGTPIAYVSDHTNEDEVRLSFELGQRVETRSFQLEPYLTRGNRIVVDFYPTGSNDTHTQSAPSIPTQIAAAAGKPGEVGTIHSVPEPRARPKPDREVRSEQDTTPSRYHLSGTWEQEWAVETGDWDNQKFEALIEPRLDVDLPNDATLTAIARLRADAVGDLGPDDNKPENYSSINGPWRGGRYASVDLREFYLDGRSSNLLWRFGKQQVVWGQADGIKVMDVVNPQSFREFILDDFDDSRIPLWMLNTELLMGDAGSLQLLWIPDTTYHELAEPGSPFAATSVLLVPEAPPGLDVRELSPARPDDPLSDSDAGLRYSAFAGGWDITLNYFYHYQDLPVPYRYLSTENGQPVGVLAPEYERNHLVGGTLSNVFGAFTLRGELAYNSDSFHVASNALDRGVGESSELSSVLGVDWQWDARDTLVSAQWFQSHLLDYESAIRRSETEHTLSLLYQRDFDYDTWSIEALGLYSVDRGDRWLNLKLSHMYRDNLEIWLGGDFFAGTREGIYGQYGSRDRILLGVELGF